MKKVEIYTAIGCKACEVAEEFLNNIDVNVIKIDISEDKNAIKELRELGFTTIPVIKIGEKYVEKFNPAKIMRLLNEQYGL